MGLVSEVVYSGGVEALAPQKATQTEALPVYSNRSILRALMSGMKLPLAQGQEVERKSFRLVVDVVDKTEGNCVGLDKRLLYSPAGRR